MLKLYQIIETNLIDITMLFSVLYNISALKYSGLGFIYIFMALNHDATQETQNTIRIHIRIDSPLWEYIIRWWFSTVVKVSVPILQSCKILYDSILIHHKVCHLTPFYSYSRTYGFIRNIMACSTNIAYMSVCITVGY